MKIQIITPAALGSQAGNNITAGRWARLLTELGHRVEVARGFAGEPDLVVALHARRSFEAISAARVAARSRPVVVALTGTDLYGDLPHSAEARQALEWAARIVVLQPLALDELEPRWKEKARVIVQSAEALASRAPSDSVDPPNADRFDVCVLGHLRAVKDPFRAAAASRLLHPGSRVRVIQAGAALSAEYAERARAEERENPRYRWLGELTQAEARRLLAQSRLLVLTSLSEGGANVISEALAVGTPIVSSRIPGSVGLLGADYAGYFPPGSETELARLLRRLETEARLYRCLQEQCAHLAPLVDPRRERAAWEALLNELAPDAGIEAGDQSG